jgi:rSAM/selenodomain-associated transferase 2
VIAGCLASLAPLRRRGVELIVADGGSSDDTVALATPMCDRVVHSARGRALQMNAGAEAADGEVLLFLHADSVLPDDADRLILDGLAAHGRHWGRFDVRLSGPQRMLRLVEFMMNLRSRLTGIATGDQGIFVSRAVFAACGGFPAIELMEDIALSEALKPLGRPLCLRERIVTSSRRWEQHGILRTILTMWRLRLRYFLGADPAVLARIYHGK